MELKEGMYVRTINGEIYKLIDAHSLIYFQKEQEYGTLEYQIIKSSYNIIDLIEVGDYVNGEKVTSKFDYLLSFGNADYYLNNKDIKSIVTKEQFESMEYKVGDNNE